MKCRYSLYLPIHTPVKGDIRVFQPYPGGSKHGYIDMFDGKQWAPDFKENEDWSGSGYRKFQSSFEIYRWEK